MRSRSFSGGLEGTENVSDAGGGYVVGPCSAGEEERKSGLAYLEKRADFGMVRSGTHTTQSQEHPPRVCFAKLTQTVHTGI